MQDIVYFCNALQVETNCFVVTCFFCIVIICRKRVKQKYVKKNSSQSQEMRNSGKSRATSVSTTFIKNVEYYAVKKTLVCFPYWLYILVVRHHKIGVCWHYFFIIGTIQVVVCIQTDTTCSVINFMFICISQGWTYHCC